MNTHHRQLLIATRAKYLKFKSRLEKSISSGRFDSFSRRKKNNLLARVDKFRSRVENFHLSKKGTVVAGSVISAALLPAAASAQIDPNFYLSGGGSINISNANDVAIANLDQDADLEIILATNNGGYFAKFDQKDGYNYDNPSSLDGAIDHVMLGDLDGDGDIDIIFAENDDGLYVYKAINNGYGSFTSTYLFDLNSSSDVNLVDWDSDGDLDVVSSSFGSIFEVLVNDGSGNFTEHGDVTLNETSIRNIEFSDIDNDGDNDLIYVAYTNSVPYIGTVNILENTTDGPGVPTFDLLNPVTIHQAGYRRFDNITTLDFDNDGDLDLFFNNTSGAYGYSKKNNLIEGTALLFTDVNVSNLGGSSFTIRDAAVADFDNDGDDDIILAASGFNRMLSFDGVDLLDGVGGDLGSDIGNVSNYFNRINVGDLSGDGNLDLIGVNGGPYASIYIDNAAPYIDEFTGRTIIDENSPIGSQMGVMTFGDIQGDPVTVTLIGPDAAFFNLDEITGELTISSELDWETQGSDLIFRAELSDGNKSRIQEGILKMNNLPEQGNGTFSTEPIQLFGTREVRAFEPGDFDMDGDADMFLSSYATGLSNSFLRQNGGSFSDEPSDAFPYTQDQVKFVRSDDSQLDIFVHDRTTDEIRLHNNGGEGWGSYEILRTGITQVMTMITGDFDGDNLTDIAIQAETSTTDEVVIFFEDGDEGWAETQYFQMRTSAGGGLLAGVGDSFDEIAIADLNGDGMDDMLATTINGNDVVFFGGEDLGGGDGYGFSSSFSSVITQPDGGETAVQIGDIDGDGSQDIAVVRWTDNASYALMLDLHLNDGNGAFTLDQTIDLGGEYAIDFEMADIDANGTNDFIFSILRTEDVGGELQLSTDIETFVNDGAGNLTQFQLIPDVGGEDFKMMDVDGDDDLDIVVQYGFTGGEEVIGQLTVFKNENVIPTSINLSATAFDEHLDLDSEVGTLSVDDLNPGDSHAYALTTGDGTNDLHNSYFNVSGNSLTVVKDVRFEDTPQLNLYLSVNDGTHTFEQAFVLDINDVNLTPTGMTLSATSFDEGTTPGTEIASITAVDPNSEDTHMFDFATGDGTNDADNGSFILDGNRLIIIDETNFETKSSYNIYLTTSDIDNSVDQAFVLTVNDVNQAATAMTLSNDVLDEGTAAGTVIASITVTDPNVGDVHELDLVTGDGTNDASNHLFLINGNELILIGDVDFDVNTSLNILLSADDGFQTYEQAFTLTVNDVLGLDDETKNSLGIYPNPGNDRLEINMNNSLRGHLSLKISDLSGRFIHGFEEEKSGENWTKRIDMTSAEPGIYIIEISLGEKRIIQRWIKE